MNKTKVENLLKELAEFSKECYKPEFFSKISMWKKLGMTLARNTNDIHGFAEMACVFFEDWNYHNTAFVLDWIHEIYQVPGKAFCNTSELDRLKNIFNKDVATWEFDNNNNIIEKKYRVTVTFEEIK